MAVTERFRSTSFSDLLTLNTGVGASGWEAKTGDGLRTNRWGNRSE